MFEALLIFIRELFFKNETLDIRSKDFNIIRLISRFIIILSFILNYFLLGRYIHLADKHYKVENKILMAERADKNCTINFAAIDKAP